VKPRGGASGIAAAADSFEDDFSFNDPSGEAGKEGVSLMLP
jgi:hypothetical protein